MSIQNKRTLDVYMKTGDMYLKNSAEHDKKNPARAEQKRQALHKLITQSFTDFPENAKVFEIGSGEGFNSKFMQDLGYEVTAGDVPKDFIEATETLGIKTIKFDVLEDDFPEKYYGVFCWRVFVHFTKLDAEMALQKVYDALEDGGVFIFNAINKEETGIDGEWKDFEGDYHMGIKRYYSYFTEQFLSDAIKKTGFKIKNFHKEGGDTGKKWLVYVLEK